MERVKAQRNPAAVMRPEKLCPPSNASGSMVSAIMVRMAPAARAVVAARVSCDKPSVKRQPKLTPWRHRKLPPWRAGGTDVETPLQRLFFMGSKKRERREPEDVSAMLRLHELGWGAKRIAAELGVSRNTVRRYLRQGVGRDTAVPGARGPWRSMGPGWRSASNVTGATPKWYARSYPASWGWMCRCARWSGPVRRCAGSCKCQGSCRIGHAAIASLCCSTLMGFPGLRKTVVSGCQLRVAPLQRSGCWALTA